MTVPKTREMYIRHNRVPLPDIYSLISEAFRITHTGETETSSIGAALALGRVEVGWVAVLPVPGDLESWPVFERNDRRVAILDTRFGDNIHDPMQGSRGLDSSLKRL